MAHSSAPHNLADSLARDLAAMSVMFTEKPGMDERAAEKAWREKHCIPESYKKSLPYPTKFLHSALFGAADKRRPRRTLVNQKLTCSSGGHFVYTGTELRQDDETVLLCLLGTIRGRVAASTIRFQPRDVCREIAWANGPHSVTRLKASLSRMLGSKIEAFDAEGELYWGTGLVHEFSCLPGAEWEVTLSARLAWALHTKSTYFDMKVRQQLAEGFDTWMYGWVKSNAGGFATTLRKLAQVSGVNYAEPRDFKKRLRQTMNLLTELKVVEAWFIEDEELKYFK